MALALLAASILVAPKNCKARRGKEGDWHLVSSFCERVCQYVCRENPHQAVAGLIVEFMSCTVFTRMARQQCESQLLQW